MGWNPSGGRRSFDCDCGAWDELTGDAGDWFEIGSNRPVSRWRPDLGFPAWAQGADKPRLGVVSDRFAPHLLTKSDLSAWHRNARGLLHSRSAFGIGLPLTANVRRHLGCGCSSVVEHDLAKVGVEGSSPFARSRFSWYLNDFRWAAERRPRRFRSWGSLRGAASRPGGDDARSLCFLLFEFLCRKNAAVTKRSQFLKGSRLQGELQALHIRLQ